MTTSRAGGSGAVRPRVYLDANASEPLRPEARAAMLDALDSVGNPSSVHAEGRAAREIVEGAREEVAALVGAAPGDVVFMSGASEAANTVVRGGYAAILASGIEHPCVLEPIAASGARRLELAVDEAGIIRSESVARALDSIEPGRTRTLLCLQAASNETGVLQPVSVIAAMARERGVDVFCDGVQAAGRRPIRMDSIGADALALSAHKIGGPKGIGALIVRPGWRLAPLMRGGGQEQNRRAGTENIVGIAGFAAAARAASKGLRQREPQELLRDRLEVAVVEMTPGARIVGSGADRLANTSCIAVRGRSAETLVISLDLAGIAVSAGAACSSGKVAVSHVLAAIGLEPELARSAIRVSLPWSASADDVDRFLDAWRAIAGTHASRAAA